MFDEMIVIVRLGEINLLTNFFMNGFVLMLYIILESPTKFWAVFERQAVKRWKLFWGRKLRTKELGLH